MGDVMRLWTSFGFKGSCGQTLEQWIPVSVWSSFDVYRLMLQGKIGQGSHMTALNQLYGGINIT